MASWRALRVTAMSAGDSTPSPQASHHSPGCLTSIVSPRYVYGTRRVPRFSCPFPQTGHFIDLLLLLFERYYPIRIRYFLNLDVQHPIFAAGAIYVLPRTMIGIRRHRFVEIGRRQREQNVPDVVIKHAQGMGADRRRRRDPYPPCPNSASKDDGEAVGAGVNAASSRPSTDR